MATQLKPAVHTAEQRGRILRDMKDCGPHYLIGYAREALNPLTVRVFGEADTLTRLRELFDMFEESRS